MPTLITDSPDYVYGLINTKVVEWGAAVKVQIEAIMIASTSTTIAADMANIKNANTTIGSIRDHMKECVKKHNTYFRDEKAYLTMMKETALKVDVLVAAAYDEAAYEEILQLASDLSTAIDAAYGSTAN